MSRYNLIIIKNNKITVLQNFYRISAIANFFSDKDFNLICKAFHSMNDFFTITNLEMTEFFTIRKVG